MSIATENVRKLPKQARAQATVEAILTATAEVLTEHGYEGATTNAIARRAGVSIGSLYQYFPHKEALVTALCDRHMQEMTALVVGEVAALRGLPLAHAIRALIRTLLRAHNVAPRLHRVLIEQVPRIAGFDRIAQVDRMIVELIRRELERRDEALRPADLELAGFILVHSVQAITHAAILDRPDALDDDALCEETAALVLRYLLADPQPQPV
ncbi:MAG: TetR family transcriptional regulator [Deltaproteobacteria bacterium]|nr:TetR family transcriptional regulator [Deltaproteobacteria bacterium]MBK8235566.1 TetR family transcriptional regulator [Deltaproteobacteria bacterium]MBK8713197.1 TetR family transcriptional regulator [Deltaproteobacteria bacterium]MBP7286775.1 TetR family transcriptional regulator [Nannocystaceae bacterium]